MGVEKPELGPHSHSNFTVVLKSGESFNSLSDACYSMLWSGYPDMTELYLWFPERNIKGLKEYVDWLLNSEIFGDAFLTKSYEEGMEKGFQVDIHQPTNYLFMSMAGLRFPWECENCEPWCWGQFVEDGFTEVEALFLTVNSTIDEGKLHRAMYNSNHLPIPRTTHLKHYKKDSFNIQVGTMFEGVSSKGVEYNWPSFGCKMFSILGGEKDKWGEYTIPVQYNPEEIKKILRKEEETV